MSINWDEIKDYKPKRDFMYYIHRWVITPLSTAKYWLRTHTINRYHMIDIRTPEYDWGWIDRDYAILAANFNILKEFVEKECKPPYFDLVLTMPEEDDGMPAYWAERVAMDNEIKELYDWWTKGRWKDRKTFDEAESFTYEDMENLDQIDQSNLHRLINIRQRLWT